MRRFLVFLLLILCFVAIISAATTKKTTKKVTTAKHTTKKKTTTQPPLPPTVRLGSSNPLHRGLPIRPPPQTTTEAPIEGEKKSNHGLFGPPPPGGK